MKKLLNRKVLIATLTVLLVCSLSLNVLGAGSLIEINAQLHNGMNVMLHGKKFEPKETDGSRIIPIIYKGRTYLPLRATAEAVGLEVTWDQNTQTAYLGNVAGEVKTNEIKYTNATPEYTNGEHLYYTKSRNAQVLTIPSGKVFEFGYTHHDPDYYAGYSLMVNTDFQYHKFKASIWVDDVKDENGQYSPYPPKLEFKDENGALVKSIAVEWGKLYEVELDILDVKELHIWVEGSKSIIGEPRIGKP